MDAAPLGPRHHCGDCGQAARTDAATQFQVVMDVGPARPGKQRSSADRVVLRPGPLLSVSPDRLTTDTRIEPCRWRWVSTHQAKTCAL